MSDWTAIGFTPAPNGWHAQYLHEDGSWQRRTICGWLTLADEAGEVVVTAATTVDGMAVSAVELPGFQMVAGPDDAIPSDARAWYRENAERKARESAQMWRAEQWQHNTL